MDYLLLETNTLVDIYVNVLKDYTVYSDVGLISRYTFLKNLPSISQEYVTTLASIYDFHIVKYSYSARWKSVGV